MELILIASFAVAASVAAASLTWGAVAAAVAGGEERRVRERLRAQLGNRPDRARVRQSLLSWISYLGERLSSPFVDEDGQRKRHLRRELVKAGIYAPGAMRLIVSMRIVLMGTGVVAGYLWARLLGYDWLLTVPAGGLIGYMLPRLWLHRRIKHNHRLLERGLPDGLDLLVICVEAGLTIDSALQRVSEELYLVHPALAREFSICNMETRIGLPRATALKNLGTRSGFAPLQGLTAMLIQTDRFGTSVADALRVQAESIRKRRQHRAEEAAAKASVKLSFPLVLFIFPASFLVLAGPMVINFMINGFFGGE